MAKTKEIKKNGEVIATLTKGKDGKWTPNKINEDLTTDEKLVMLTEEQSVVDMRIDDVLRVFEKARYFESASMNEREPHNNSMECSYNSGYVTRIHIENPEVEITDGEIDVDGDDKSFSFDIEELDKFNVYGYGDSLYGFDENNNKLVRVSFEGYVEKNENGNSVSYYMSFIIPVESK